MKLYKDFEHSTLHVPPTESFSLHHNKYEASQPLEAVSHHPTELHGRAHGRQTVVNEPHCAAKGWKHLFADAGKVFPMLSIWLPKSFNCICCCEKEAYTAF